jgi:hypothetical protein
LGPQVSLEMGSQEGRILPSSSLEEPTSKPLIQYKRKGRKPKSVMGQGKHKDVGCSKRACPLNSAGGFQTNSHLKLSLFCSSFGFGDEGQEDKAVAFLSALVEDHRRRDKLEDCELWGLRVGLFCGLFLVGSVVRLILLVYSVCTRGVLRCFF